MGFLDKLFKKIKPKEKSDELDNNFESSSKINSDDNKNDNLLSNVLKQKEDYEFHDDVISFKNKGDFRYLNDLIQKGENEINLDSDIIFDEVEKEEFKKGIEIASDNLVINGNNHDIDARELTCIFNITGKNIVLNDINFKNAFSDSNYGAAIKNEGENIKLVNCSFSNNSVNPKNFFDGGDGGAIYNDNNASLQLIKCKFTDNCSKWYGGAIANEGKLILDNCIFNNNIAYQYGGALYNYTNGRAKLKNCHFDYNNAKKASGGAIYNTNGANMFLEECHFEYNYANVDGSAIHNSNGSLICHICDFKNNDSGNGSVVWNDRNLELFSVEFSDDKSRENFSFVKQEGDEDTKLKIEDSTFSFSSLKYSNIINIDAGFCNIDNCKFNIYDINENSFAIYNNGILEVKKLKFKNFDEYLIYNSNALRLFREDSIDEKIKSSSTSSLKFLKEPVPMDYKGFTHLDDLIKDSDSNVYLSYDIKMDINEQNFYEGGILLNKDNLVIDGLKEDGTKCEIDANGLSRVFLVMGKDIVIKNIRFYNGKYFRNYLDDENDGGGSILVSHDASLTIENCEFIESHSRNSAGSICNKGTLTVKNGTLFKNNTSQFKGGSIINENSLVLSDSIFENNYADSAGGVYSENDSPSTIIKKCKFIRNHASVKAGAIENRSTFFELDDCYFDENKSEVFGSCIYNDGHIDSNFKNSVFENNNSSNGGVICNARARVEVENCKFIKNFGTYGGALMNVEGTINFHECKFINNSGEHGGAIINGTYNDVWANPLGVLNFYHCLFEGNTASKSSQSIFNRGGKLKLDYCDFIGSRNKIITNEGNTEITHCNFQDNHIINNDGKIMVLFSEFEKLNDVIEGGEIERLDN